MEGVLEEEMAAEETVVVVAEEMVVAEGEEMAAVAAEEETVVEAEEMAVEEETGAVEEVVVEEIEKGHGILMSNGHPHRYIFRSIHPWATHALFSSLLVQYVPRRQR
jgi:hypothetical protein